ncbi:hypothetical protein NFL61_23180 (plasmid) [Enterobacter ludwigii]|uniref:hypothetical protein n=1 Tax=Enterobacter TaxID=547 RepID=UPI0021672860|nr:MULTISPECIES: hypothetical protein [Enterobacter]MCS3490849.1 hypothetical protein [Enterobacter sp. SLBN-59]WGC22696.1 hypothetical protein NFL61_23180 [Enterobacter ludwigii]
MNNPDNPGLWQTCQRLNTQGHEKLWLQPGEQFYRIVTWDNQVVAWFDRLNPFQGWLLTDCMPNPVPEGFRSLHPYPELDLVSAAPLNAASGVFSLPSESAGIEFFAALRRND